MKRPSFQFYPADWRANAKLRRCTAAERGDWIDLMCLLHDSEEYGILRWPLKDIAQALGCKPAQLKALHDKGVLKGADAGTKFVGHTYTPRHAGKAGEEVTLIEPQDGPIWFSSRMVEDEYVRTKRATQGAYEQPPKPPIGGTKGEHPSRDARAQSSSSSTTSTNSKDQKSDVGLKPDTSQPGGKNGHDHDAARELRRQAIVALTFLNEKTGRNYEPVPANVDPIVARLKQGSTLDDLRAVIAKKCREWSGDEKMAPYLRPKTLFNATNFANYKGELAPAGAQQ